ncbi:hypothetical protein C8J57DRAFT_1470514 [Mycena rebaudengoi]|nr:hypothetical protein C8J57DRAFT_1470514 [Mycena rebaudengoi]
MGNILVKIAPTSAISTSFFPPSPAFIPARDMPDLTGKIALVTGGNTGIGYETTKALLLKGAKVYIASRSPEKTAAAIEKLKAETQQTAVFVHLDLANLTSVRKAATEFLALESRLDILFNNGGLMASPIEMLTIQKYDLQFGTNVLGHFFLTELLIPALTASHDQNKTPARVIHISSYAHNVLPTPRGIEMTSLKDGPERDAWIKKWGTGVSGAPTFVYGQSKLGNIIVSNWHAKEYKDILVSCALHPGTIRSGVMQHVGEWQGKIWNAIMCYPTIMGTLTQLWAGTTASPEEINGQYLIPWARVAPIGVVNRAALDKTIEAEVINCIPPKTNRRILNFSGVGSGHTFM